MTLTIVIPEWFGWIAVAFVAFYLVASIYDRWWDRRERKDYIRRNQNG